MWQTKDLMGREFMGVIRTSFLIDEQGDLLHIFDDFNTEDHNQVVLDYLRKN